MSTSYQIGRGNRDTVRLLIGDTGANATWLFQDEELDALLLLEGNLVHRTCAVAIQGLSATKAQTLYSFRTDDFSEDQGKINDYMAALVQRFLTLGDSQIVVQQVDQFIDVQDYIRPETIYAELQPGEHTDG